MLTAASLPPLYRAADNGSMEAQKRFLSAQRTELCLIVGAAVLFEVSLEIDGVRVAVLAAAVLMLVAMIVRLRSGEGRLAARWYDYRAAAESIKTLSWQYSVGGSAFPLGLDDDDARDGFEQQLRELLERDLQGLTVPAPPGESQLTAAMEELRGVGLDERRQAYVEGRVDDQLSWYRDKARINGRAARRWGRLLIAGEITAAVIGVLMAMGWIGVNISGPVAAAVAAGVAWKQTKQFSVLAESYSVTSQDIAALRRSVEHASTEHEWAEAVHDAEAAFSREHTMWRARRQR